MRGPAVANGLHPVSVTARGGEVVVVVAAGPALDRTASAVPHAGAASTHTTVLLREAVEAGQVEVAELEVALGQVKELKGLLPICAYCKAVRDDQNYWHRVETYIAAHRAGFDAIKQHADIPVGNTQGELPVRSFRSVSRRVRCVESGRTSGSAWGAVRRMTKWVPT